MASVVRDPGGRKRILFFGTDGARKAIRIGKCTAVQAQAFKTKIEALIVARMQGSVIDQDTARWVAELPDAVHTKLARFGLVDARARRTIAALLSVGDLCDQYIAERDDVKPNTREVYTRTRKNLVAFFGRDKLIGTVTPYEAEQWRRELGRLGLSEATVRKRCGVAKQFFAAAVKRRALEQDPFAGLKSSAIANESRRYFLTRADAEKIMEACPDAEWRLIFALARFGGLRTPSETLALKWTDITKERIVIHSPKTEHHEGKAERVIPLFPELQEPLREAFELAPAGSEFVIARHRQRNCNLRTQFLRIVERAGLKPWQKLFQNLRSTRETELAETYPLHVVVAWLGNSQLVAAKHYLQVTDEHYRQAVQTAQNPAQSTPTNAGKPGQADGAERDKPADFPGFSGERGGLPIAGAVPSGAFS